MRRISSLFVLSAAFVFCPLFGFATDKFQINVVETTGSVSTGSLGIHTNATAKVILPNGDHADLLCGGDDGHCAKISPKAPEKMRPDATECSNVGNTTICVTRDLGNYTASRKGNVLTIETPKGKLKFDIVGSW